MISRVILICAGRAERWGNYLGIPKHLISINGEPLLDRTLRLLRTHTAAEVTIVAFDPAYSRLGCDRFEPLHGPLNFCDTDKFLSSQSLWSTSGQTVILYGDVFFTEAALQTILAHKGTHEFFGRREGSYFTGCPWRELFAISFPADEHALLTHHMMSIRQALLAGEITAGGGWAVYEHMHNDGTHFTTIDDFTDDFDFPADYDRWTRRYNNRLHRALVPLYGVRLKRWRWRLHAWRKRLARVRH